MINKSTTDIFGTAFKDYIKGETGNNIIVHTNLAEDEILPVKYFFRNFNELPDIEKKAIAMCYGKILDIGSGAGCHSLILQQKGFNVTSLDISKGAVDIQKKRGIKNVIQENFFTMNHNKNFDTLLVLMDSIGLVQNFDGLTRFLSKSKELLNNDGQILINSTDLLYLYLDNEGKITIDLTERYYGELTYQLEYKDIKGAPFEWVFFDFDNLESYAEEAGFTTELVYEDTEMNYLAVLKKMPI